MVDAMCARCGSSCSWEHCWECEDGYVERDFGDDVVPEYHPVPCPTCNATGGWYRCLSSSAWCAANPLRGRERGAVEMFQINDEDERQLF